MDQPADELTPENLPEGCRFYDVEDSPYVEVPGKGWLNAWGGNLKPRDADYASRRVFHAGIQVSREEWLRLVEASKR